MAANTALAAILRGRRFATASQDEGEFGCDRKIERFTASEEAQELTGARWTETMAADATASGR
jgi:hypothetical protein